MSVLYPDLTNNRKFSDKNASKDNKSISVFEMPKGDENHSISHNNSFTIKIEDPAKVTKEDKLNRSNIDERPAYPVLDNKILPKRNLSVKEMVESNISLNAIGNVVQVHQPEKKNLPPPEELGNKPFEIFCNNCRRTGNTIIHHEVGSGTWGMCMVLTCLGCIPCFFLPFCIHDCQDTIHICPYCGAEIIKYRFILGIK